MHFGDFMRGKLYREVPQGNAARLARQNGSAALAVSQEPVFVRRTDHDMPTMLTNFIDDGALMEGAGKEIGLPLPEETEDEFVERAKGILARHIVRLFGR